MTRKEADQYARILGQCHDAFGFLAEAFLSGNQNQTVSSILSKLKITESPALSFIAFAAIVFIYSHDCVAKPLKCAEKLLTLRNLKTLRVTINDRNISQNEPDQAACLRHLRNCFAHGQFTLERKGNTLWVSMLDQTSAGKKTFEARCKAEQVVRVAEKALLKAYKIMQVKAK